MFDQRKIWDLTEDERDDYFDSVVLAIVWIMVVLTVAALVLATR
jgi:hypothetical protein